MIMVFRSGLLTYLAHCVPVLGTHPIIPSPKASTGLICHTNHASECYPRIFQPTEKFRPVHDDQILPPGLHVRVNLATGVKVARLNLPEPEEDNLSSGLVIIEDTNPLRDESTRPEDPSINRENVHSQQLFGSPPHNLGEGSIFVDSVSKVKDHASKDTDMLVTALTDLEDLSHSYNWGVTLAKDVGLSQTLFQLLLPSQPSLEVRSLAALVLGTAMHSNPAALDAILTHSYNDVSSEGPLEAAIQALREEQAPILLNRMVFLLSSLCQDDGQLLRFLESGGTEVLIQVYDAKFARSQDTYKLRRRISHFIDDRLKGQFPNVANRRSEDLLKEMGTNHKKPMVEP
ncbi:MAG: hypothetical protein Q9170_000357 [Blastenia crenularia]